MRPEISYELDGRQNLFAVTKDEITIGRGADNDIVIERPSVSRRHARVFRENDGWRVQDMGSLNGTRVNEHGEDAKQAARLSNGDVIYVDTFQLTFRDREPQAPRISLSESEPAMGTVIQSTVDFASLASKQDDGQRLQKLLTIVTRASQVILSSPSLDDTFERVLDLIFEHLPIERGLIMLWDEAEGQLKPAYVKDRSHAGADTEIRFSRTIADRVYRDKVAMLTTDAQTDTRFSDGASVFELGIRSALAAPLWNGDRVEGLIYVDTLKVNAFDNFVLDLLSALGNNVAVAIEHSRLQRSLMEGEFKRRRLERYHSPAVVELITASEDADETLRADEREVTIVFVDVVDFTRRTEEMEPRDVAGLLNLYFSRMAEEIFRHQGMLDKFMGDCLMAVFGAPIPSDDHARRALDAVLDMRDALNAVNDGLPEEQRLVFRVGVHSGRVIAGDIGSVRRSDYTVLGKTVNLASRLESAVARPGQIIISEATRASAGAGYRTSSVGEHRVKGLSDPIPCFELLGRDTASATET